MKKKHPVLLTILITVLVVLIIFVTSLLISSASDADRMSQMNKQLSLGIRCLNELDFEMAVVHFDQVLAIDERNVAAYIGNALAYDQMGNQEMAIQTLQDGLEATGNDVLMAMLEDMQAGKNLEQHYSMVETEEKLQITEDPFGTLELLGSDYYQWDFNACAELFGFEYEEYAGRNVGLGFYKGMDIYYDATDVNVKFTLENEDYIYGYRLLSASQLQMFRIDCTGNANNVPALSEVSCNMEMGRSYEEILSIIGLPQMEDNVYYSSESNVGMIGYIQYQENGITKLYISLADRQLLGLDLSFREGKLVSAVYSCGIPDNLRSKLVSWIGNLLH